jgi:uncharacterized protein with HEPN domain
MPSDAAPTPKEELAWLAILDNARLAQDFVSGMTLEQFANDRRTFYAVTRCLEIVSEAARRLRGVQQEQHLDLPWRQIEDSGNFFRHVYQTVAETQVWMTVSAYLPPLIAAAEAALSETPPRTHRPK